jgi:carboxyl-terminal processing protease
MQVKSVDGRPIVDAVRERLGKSLRGRDVVADNWALLLLLSGNRQEKRKIEVINGDNKSVLITVETQTLQEKKSLIEYKLLDQNIGYIKINNSLGDIDLIGQFDLALDSLKNTKGLLLDLRDTPSGGNTTVARGIMGRFVSRDMPYQKHSLPSEERLYGTKRSWVELVSPRGRFMYKAPIIILVNHWTGSMGEGIAIGLDGMKRATVVGTEMARLLGATSHIKLPNTGIGVNFPSEKLFHINDTPREKYIPRIYVDLLKIKNLAQSDVIFDRGLMELK